TFSSTTDWEPLANLTQVFAGDVSSYVPLANNWMEIPLTTPFNYNNTDNLVIAVDENTSDYASMSWGAFTSGSNTGIYYYNDSTNPDPASPPTASSRTGTIDRIQLVFPNSSAPLAPTLLSPSNGGWAMIGDILSWTPTSGAGDATTYDVYFGTSTNPPLVSSNQAATTYTPTLIAGTTYYWKVVARNELGDSPASAIWSFKTPTATQLAESFENTSFPPGGWANPGTWSRSTSYAKHGTASAYKYGSSSSQYILSTPKVTITSTSTLNFWSLCSSTSGILQIVYSPDRTTWTQIGSDITYAATYTMYNTVVDLSSLAGNNYYLGFRTAYSGSYYVDFVLGPEITSEAPGAPTLSTPADLATNVNELTTFTWTVPTTGGVPTGYKLYCDTNNPPTTLKADLNALTYTLTTPLAYNTTYYWTVLAYNGAGEGPTATVRSFTTRADPIISTFPWVVDFGTLSTDWPVLNWSQLTGLLGGTLTTGTQWFQDDFGNVTTPVNKSAKINIYGTSRYGWLITPPIAIPGAGYELKFDLALTTYSGITSPTPGAQADDRFIVLISDSPLMTNPTVLREWNNTGSTYVYDNISPSGENHIISLNTYSGTKYLAFYGESTVSNGDNDLFVDNVTVREIPAAPIISCNPSSWDFGQVQINTTKTKDFTISNIGAGTLNVSSIAIAGDYYTLLTNPAPVGLAAGQSAIFTVQYAPTALGTQNGTVTITDNRGTTIVNLSAVCYDPTITSAQLPYSNGFEETWTGTPPAPVLGWTVIDANSDSYTWRRGPTYITAHTGSYIAQGMGNTDDWLITPPIQASVDLRIKWWDAVESASYPNTYTVLVSTTDNNIASFTNNLGTFTCNWTTWTEHTLNLNAFTGNTIYVAFHQTASGSTYYDFGIDDFLLEAIPAAPIFSYTPASINFGSVQQNHPATPVNVIVTNTGGGTLNLSSSDISITGPNAAMFSFSSTNLPAALGAGQSVNIPVSVTVTQEGPVSATLSINYNSTNYDVALSAEGLPAGTVIIGTGTSTQRQPFGTLWGYERSAALYTNAQIGGYGLLDKVAWNCAATTTTVVPYKIYAMQTSDTAFTAMSWNTFTASATLVDEGTHIFSTTGWHLFELDTPFSYVSGNLIVAVETYYGGSGGGSGHTFYYSTGAANSHQYWYADTTPPTGTGTLNTSLPNIMLQFGELPSGPPDPVTLVYPTNGAVGIPQTGFNLTWTRALTGGMPSYYVVYMSQDETTIYDDYYWETTNTHFNPVTDPAPESRITFNYLDRWYWTVEAVNDDGSAVVDPPYSFEIMADPHVNIPYTQDFGTAGTWPLNWAQTYSGGISSDRWSLSNTNTAGGTAYEMMASWASGTGISRLIAPPLNTDGIANFAINFNTYYDDYAAGITAKVQYSFDLNTWFDTPWSIISGSGNVTGNQTALITGLTNQPTTYVAWVLDGNHYQFDYWYIDDVAISLPPNHDVTVVSYDVENQVVPENTVVTPMATVGNNGLNTETFAVTCTIGTYSSTQTVSGLAMGATQQVTFAPVTPALWTAESVEITTNLVGDEVPANDTFYSALICLPLNVTGLANNAQTDQFVQFNLANPGVLNALPNSYTGSYFIAGADWKNGQWLGVEYDDGTLATDNYVNIDPLTGIYTDQGDLGAALMGNAWDDTHDIMYGVASTGYLYVMDPATGAIGVGD
ncbi:MAG: choice-of-anchor J domain-containing protein, partial [Candidatus Cloacimonas sp.]|nr:choice-of-anchor J domain-containing protein [Candidatus Cloacimonas sp.]